MAKVRCVRAFVGFGRSFSPGDELEGAEVAEALANFSEFFVAFGLEGSISLGVDEEHKAEQARVAEMLAGFDKKRESEHGER